MVVVDPCSVSGSSCDLVVRNLILRISLDVCRRHSRSEWGPICKELKRSAKSGCQTTEAEFDPMLYGVID